MPQVFAVASFYGAGMTEPQARSDRPLCPVLVHLPTKGLFMSPESVDAFVALQRDQPEAHLLAHRLAHPGAKSPVVQIDQYDAAYGFDDAGSRQHDLVASQAARLKTSAFFDAYLNF